MDIFDAAATARLTPYPALVDALATAVADYAEGRITSPERLVVPLNDDGVLLSMPATARDLAIHKLVNVCPRNRERGLPTIHGQVMAIEPDTGEMLFILDGPTVTGRRTAAMSMLGVRTLSRVEPRDVLLIGTGMQAVNHLEAIGELYPDALVRVRGSVPERAQAFCEAHVGKARRLQPMVNEPVPDSVDLVITLTTSRTPVYDEAPREGRLVVGVGAFRPDMAELGPRTLRGSTVFVDDPAGAKHEAGDLIQARVEWGKVTGIAAALAARHGSADGARAACAFKTVGCAAWDLAACRLARNLRSLVTKIAQP
ncbi:bifunctional Delta(1)-pyrroline-2-carboxylate/Delta(1)-piperideine-2-carboxylate reductase [Paraburkholderia rhizosphaerae]|uniref:1-piperideine-2-carboxylate/1-pyrroline-2-carboxylate reductase [NAD(P)H] n=1 Tax=Paraburkholderia rhizosphaerae TaxID=480658 RepID=A0A4R8LNN9_9BURK|nr:bifunctional Delta(1)-pyrroline-2-carboxylate/Delta(1)-piperideine-2-carboxylate reductase [Paraburkholderia rhizosphaerae]TDY45429.1 1-piperideine-2-carboxylate/1-pyrroline-2-carboxylate reductase [NAD(P)H] [Paraburkholderia rhizosphaerae]